MNARILLIALLGFLGTPDSIALARLTQVPPASGIPPISIPPAKPGGMELLIPARINTVPPGNDYNNPDSEYCFQRSRESDHFVIFWAKEYGQDPMANSLVNRRFDVDAVLRESEITYNYYIRQLNWAPGKDALSRKYKFLILVTGGSEGSAYGWMVDNKVGVMWTPAVRINRGPYGIIAHELGHSFQGLSRADGAESFESGAAFTEMTSQFMLWQIYPEWQTFENYHLKAFMKKTHLAFMHEDNHYHTCYPLEYWSFRHGQDFIGRMWREVRKGEDAVMTYQRLTKIDQVRFNDEMFDACRRFVTWDMPRVEKVSARYANQHTTSLEDAGGGWYQIAAGLAPENYGYNAIRLKVPPAGGRVRLSFKGVAGKEGFSQTRLEQAGWRYGFLAHRKNGERVYGGIHSQKTGVADFTVPADTEHLWLVVMGAPAEHWIRYYGRRNKDGVPAEQWPYQIKLDGTAPDASVLK
ncbi:MAG: hypothetical protein EOP87_06075 [Verrucomicrobiaceae bacterium]|nr:MAG: hypothetical protein EOP87_06075 [Verrucomicrobiaceae bacterium]